MVGDCSLRLNGLNERPHIVLRTTAGRLQQNIRSTLRREAPRFSARKLHDCGARPQPLERLEHPFDDVSEDMLTELFDSSHPEKHHLIERQAGFSRQQKHFSELAGKAAILDQAAETPPKAPIDEPSDAVRRRFSLFNTCQQHLGSREIQSAQLWEDESELHGY